MPSTASPRRHLAAVAAVAAFGVFAPAASAAGPDLVTGNPGCASVQGAETWTEIKIEPIKAGVTAFGDANVTGEFTADAKAQYFDFTAAPGVDAVIVKGGNDSNVYTYDPDATSDQGLHAPINPNTGEPYQLSHIAFCYGPDVDPDPDPDPTPDPDPKSDPDPTTGSSSGGTAAPAGEVKGVTVSGPPTPASIKVLPAQVVSGASTLSGPKSCVDNKFTVKIRGRKIASVKITVDGRTIKTYKNAKGTGRKFDLTVNANKYGPGVHRLAARVTYAASAQTKARTHRLAFQQCARQAVAPQFTG